MNNRINILFLLRWFLLTVMTLLMTQCCLSQQIEGVLFDSLNMRVVSDAYVFINESSIGTVSNSDGSFNLDIEAYENVDLIISHIGYDNLVIPLTNSSQPIDTLYLNASAIALGEVNLVTKNKKGLRKRRLKKFEDAFLGAKAERNDVFIANPEVLLFYEENGKLKATSDEPLIIENNYLGYILRFFLSEFELKSNNDVFYKGTTSFEEKKVKLKQMAKYKRNRRKTFNQTYKRFFQQLIHQQLNEEDYLVGNSKINFQREFVQFQQLNIDSLSIVHNGNGTYMIPFEHYLTVKYVDQKPDRKIKSRKLSANFSTGLKQVKADVNDELVSYLGSKTNKIILDTHGRIMNPLDVEEFGYWASKRVASMLPLDYSHSK